MTAQPVLSLLEPLVDDAAARKARGAFFTPDELTAYICRWALRAPADRVLEPSCGEAAFLLAAARRLDELGARSTPGQLVGAELHADSAATARSLLAAAGRSAQISVGDFFEVPGQRDFDAVVGNPPYVRYQDFSGEARAASRRAALSGGVSLTALASSWAAFTVHSAEFLRPGGRLGLVLPAELLSVNYAAEVRRYLMRSFGRVRLILFSERVFPGVLEEVVLLLAEDAGAVGGTDRCELYQLASAADLARQLDDATPQIWQPTEVSAKWTAALLSDPARDGYASLLAPGRFVGLQEWGETSLGAVTGNNKYFTMSPGEAARLGLRDDELVPLSPPGSRHLRGLSFSTHMWRQQGLGGAGTFLFRPGADRTTMSAAARDYLAAGEATKVHHAYKCKVRSPWWQVPLVAVPDLFLTYMNADTPRLTTNSARVRHLNSVHGVYLKQDYRRLGQELLPLASLNTVTLLGAELVGRAYGGGMLKLEPREADRLPVPAHGLVQQLAPELRRRRPAVLRALRRGRLLVAAALVDEVLLQEGLGVTGEQLQHLAEAHQMLSGRRSARGATSLPARP